MNATCYYCGWWTDINGVCVCGYSEKPTTRSDSCMAWKPRNEIITNADRIRSMTDEELAEFLGKTKAFGYSHADLTEYFTAEFAEWLKREVNTDG